MKKITLSAFALILFLSVRSQSIEDARKLTENEQYEAATAQYKALLSGRPNDLIAYYYYGDNLLLSDNADSATIVFEKASSLDPNNPLIKIGRAKVLLDIFNLREVKVSSESDPASTDNRQRYQKAQENVAKANALIDEATANSTDVTVLVEAAEALIHYKTSDLDKAKTFLDKVLARDPKNIEAHLLYGDIYTELNNGTLAAEFYNKALDMNRASVRAIVSKGRLYKRSTNYDGAAREFENAISIDKDYAPAHRELGEAYIKLGKLSEAKEEYRKYLDLSKNNCGARIRYAFFLYAGKSYTEAINELNQVQQRCDSNNLSLLRILTYSYYENGEYDKALKTINRLMQLVPVEKRTASDLEYYGKALIKTSQDSSGNDTTQILSGIEQLQKAISLEPKRTELLSILADAYLKLKQYPNAIVVLKQKIALGKDVKVLDYYNLGSAYYYNKQFLEADTIAMKVNELTPTYASGWMLRARINAHIDSTSEAGLAKPFYEKYMERALADSPNVSKYRAGLIETYTYLGYYSILKNDKENGLIYLKKKLELDPEDKKNVQDGIDQLEGRPVKPKR